jgi:hypothetical protein
MQERCQDTTHVKAEPLVPDAPEVEILLQQALEVARRQHAQSLELRAAMPLSRLWQQMGQRAARELLDRLTRVPPKQRGGTHGAKPRASPLSVLSCTSHKTVLHRRSRLRALRARHATLRRHARVCLPLHRWPALHQTHHEDHDRDNQQEMDEAPGV